MEFWTLSTIAFIYNVIGPLRSGVRLSMILKLYKYLILIIY